ncbi:MAG: TetR/AcrR family transcriptional regulator [Caulobacterales bacterium]
MTAILNKTPKSARKAKGDGHLRRAEILEAAERIFVADGYEGATIRKIADEVGVSSTALYMHFRDKDEILVEICMEATQRLLEQNSQISAQPLDAVARVRRMLEAYVSFALQHPNAYQLMFCSAARSASSRKKEAAEDISAQCYARYSGVVRESPPRVACAPAPPTQPPRRFGRPAMEWWP